MANKIVRTVCCFTSHLDEGVYKKLEEITNKLISIEYQIQTSRICSSRINYGTIQEPEAKVKNGNYLIGLGGFNYQTLVNDLNGFYSTKQTSLYLDLTKEDIRPEHVKILYDIIKNRPSLTFNFAYGFNVPASSPYFPSAQYQQDGFALGLQPTDLSEGCVSLNQWLETIKKAWTEVYQTFQNDREFLGIDSSIAPLFTDSSSLINFIKRLNMSFNESVVTDNYTRITKFIKEQNPKAVGLCGLMFPCLEDFELADEYEQGNFSIERNIFLSLHSGLGIDTYPIGVDEEPEKILNILKLIQSLSSKYQKPLSVRFVSDGFTKIDGRTNFGNQYLKDVVIKKL